MFASKRGEALDERVARLPRLAVELRPVHGRLAEHRVPFVGVGHLVAGEQHRHAVEREHPHEHLVDGGVSPRLLATRTRVGGDVVVLVVVHELGADRTLRRASRPSATHGRRAQPREPAVVRVESLVLVAHGESLAEEHGVSAGESVHHVVRVAPEVERDAVAHVAAEAVRAELLDQVADVADQVLPQLRLGEVEFREAPGAFLHRPVRIPPGELGMFPEERRRRAAVEVHEVEHDLHAETMRRGAEILQVLVGAVLLVHVEVVGDAVLVLGIVEAAPDLARAPEGLVPVGVHLHHRHEVRDGHAEVLQVGQLLFGGLEGPLRRERARLDLVHHAAREPFGRRARVLHPGVRRIRHERHGCQHDGNHRRQVLTFHLSRTPSSHTAALT